jgi:hypothetical protein
MAALNRDARMADAYAAYLDAWRDSGGTLLMHYTDVYHYNTYGYWGAREAQTQPLSEAPKARALEQFIADSPCWWADCEQ